MDTISAGKLVILIPVTVAGETALLGVVLVNVLALTVTCVVPPGLVPAFCVPLPAVGPTAIPKFAFVTALFNMAIGSIPLGEPSFPAAVPIFSPVLTHVAGKVGELAELTVESTRL